MQNLTQIQIALNLAISPGNKTMEKLEQVAASLKDTKKSESKTEKFKNGNKKKYKNVKIS